MQWMWDMESTVPRRTKYRHERQATELERHENSGSSDEDVPRGVQHFYEAPAMNQADVSSEIDESVEDDAAADTADGTSDTVDETPDAVDETGDIVDDETSDSEKETLISSDDSVDDVPCTSFADSQDDEQDLRPTQQTELDNKLYPGSRITQGESLLLMMGHSLRYHSSKNATESLLSVIEAHLPENVNFPLSKYLFYKHFSASNALSRQHFYCPECMQYIGEVSESESCVTCKKCRISHEVTKLVKTGSYFVMLDFESQLEGILQSPSLAHRVPAPHSLDVKDITQSKAYTELPLSQDDISVTWSTDGVPLFESSAFTIWPLQLAVNELPQKERAKNLILAGLWFGPRKPEMNCFLESFVHRMNNLSSQGLSWEDAHGVSHVAHVFPGPCCVDTVARGMVMNMHQFNGRNGCAWCKHEGEVVERGNGHARVYSTAGPKHALRTHDSFLKDAEVAERTGQVTCGIKGPSILFMLSFFTFPSGFVVDYMHAVCSGFVRHTACMWLSHKSAFPYSLGGKIDEIDCRLQRMQPLWEMPRLPRSMHQRKYWKSSEWRNWLFFFSPFVLDGLLPAPFLRNWLKFVHLMRFLAAGSNPMDQLLLVKKLMFSFLKEYEELYGKENMTYNAHILLHLVDCVKNWGPLWNFSCYPFENMNGQLVKFVNGTRHAHLQIVEKYCILTSLPRLCSLHVSNSSALALLTSFTKGYKLRKHTSKVSGVFLHGKGRPRNEGVSFKKATIGIFRFCVASCDKSRRVNSYVEVNGIFGKLCDIILMCSSGHTHACPCVKEVFFLMNKLQVRALSNPGVAGLSVAPFFEVLAHGAVVKVPAYRASKCIFLKACQKIFLCRVDEAFVVEAN